MNEHYAASTRERSGLNRFVLNTYVWMIGGLLISAMSAFFLLNTPRLLVTVLSNNLIYLGLMIGQILLAISLRPNLKTLESPMSYILKFVGYSVLTGVTFAAVALVYTKSSIVSALLSTVAVFAVMTIYGFVTKADLSKLGNIIFPALIGVIIATIVNVIFFHSQGFELILSIITMLLFVGLTAYDTQKMKYVYQAFAHREETHASLVICCALELYLDFINIFLSLLRISSKD